MVRVWGWPKYRRNVIGGGARSSGAAIIPIFLITLSYGIHRGGTPLPSHIGSVAAG